MPDNRRSNKQNGANESPQIDGLERLEDLRRNVVTTVHDVRNPLAVISGNAQLLNEMAQIMDLDDDLCKAIADIDQAAQVLATRLGQLAELE